MNLKFHPHRTASRFLYVYLMNDKYQQSNIIRRFCKEYNIEVQDKPILTSVSRSERIENNELLVDGDTTNDNNALTNSHEQNNSKQISDQIHVLQFLPISPDQQSPSKRKANQIYESEQSLTENYPPTKKPARATRRKR